MNLLAVSGHTVLSLSVLLVLICATSHVSPYSLGGTRVNFYARNLHDLQNLTLRDLRAAEYLQGIRANIPVGSKLRENVDRYLADFADSNNGNDGISDFKASDIVNNPVSVYRLIRRFAFLLKSVSMEADGDYGIFPDGVHPVASSYWPIYEDLQDAMDGILRIQTVNNLNVAEFVRGNILGTQTTSRLQAVHCYEIGTYAKLRKQFTNAEAWFMTAHELGNEGDQSIDALLPVTALFDTYELHDDAFGNRSLYDPNFFSARKRSLNPGGDDGAPMREILYEKYAGKRDSSPFVAANYWALCSGDDFMTAEEKSHLFCWFEYRIHAMYAIGPLKMEFLSRNPDIVQLHEIFSETGIHKLIFRVNKLEPSTVSDEDDKSGQGVKLDSMRTSFQTRVNDVGVKLLRSSLRKVEHLTGLSVMKATAGEQTQVVAYTVGGHYDIHHDSLRKRSRFGEMGDRIATFMVYLNNVDKGGFTVFPDTMAFIKPVKGSAIFWFNSYSDGTPDFETSHGACPVVMGTKWVANKWIHYNDQFLTRQCSLRPKERYRVAVNGKYLPIPAVFERGESHYDIDEMPVITEDENRVLELRRSRKYAYGSIPGLRSLARLEYKIYQDLRSRLSIGSTYSRDLADYLSDYEESSLLLFNRLKGADNDRTDKLAWHPLCSFRMVRRFEKFIKKLISNAADSDDIFVHDVVAPIQKMYDVKDGPTEKDLEDAMMSIINIQFVYDLHVEDIARGKLNGVNTGVGLTAVHCTELSKHAVATGFYYIAVEWAEMAFKLVKNGDHSIDVQSVKETIATAVSAHDKSHQESEGWEPYFYHDRIKTLSEPSKRQLRKKGQYEEFKLKPENNFAAINYWGICQGKPHQSLQEKSKLFCWYERKIHPAWTIGPLKAEMISLYPKSEVVQYHDVLAEKIMADIKKIRAEAFMKATTGSTSVSDEERHADSKNRLATTAWLPEKVFSISMKISKLTERITGLKVVGAVREDLQVAGYTPGGHYFQHLDSAGYDTDGSQARIATLMFYLSDTVLGGGTAFCQGGAHVLPKKGSAVFWYNLYTSGEVDPLTWHGACPLVIGEKWVANKWIHYKMQSHLKCSPNQQSRHEVLTNGKSKYSGNLQRKPQGL